MSPTIELDTLFDWGAISITVTSIFSILPILSLVLPIIWWSIRIYKELKKDD